MGADGGKDDGELLPGLNSVPAVVRLGAEAWYRGAMWSVGAGIDAAERATSLALAGLGLAEDARAEAERGADGLGRREGGAASEDRRPSRARTLRERGAELLDRASDVEEDPNLVHPGFARIIDQLAPDEARILKLLVNDGPQGIVYVNKAAPFGIGAREVARRLSMIGHEAGCLHIELVPAYLDNLVRLGLVAIRRDPVLDETAYQVLEAQPEVVEAMRSVNSGIFRGQSSRRSIHITDFGLSFCRICFPPEHLTGEFDAVDAADAEVLPPEPDLDGAQA